MVSQKTTSSSNEQMQPYRPQLFRFSAGIAAASTAEFLTLPIDCAKVRLQAQGMQTLRLPSVYSKQPVIHHYNGLWDTLRSITQVEGFRSLWKGLSPALLRQASYSSLSMVFYQPFRNVMAGSADEKDATFYQKWLAGGMAGALSISVVNPVDVIKVRMQGDVAGTLYTGVMDAFRKIRYAEGWQGFARGMLPSVQRGFIVNAAELGVYDHSKSQLIESGVVPEGAMAHFGASLLAGLAGASASNPIDVIKTRLMTQGSSLGNEKEMYKGMMDCLRKTIQIEGFGALYKGFIPNVMRKGPWCIIFFVCYEQYYLLLEETFPLA